MSTCGKKRRKKVYVSEEKKDEAYILKREKNNFHARISRERTRKKLLKEREELDRLRKKVKEQDEIIENLKKEIDELNFEKNFTINEIAAILEIY